MRTLVITSSYPSKSRPTDGIFVQEFIKCLSGSVFVLAPTRGNLDGMSELKLPWLGGEKALAELKAWNPLHWLIALHFFLFGCVTTVLVCRRLRIERTLCFWTVPSAIFGLAARLLAGVSFDSYSLGSDIWKFKGSRVGRFLLRRLLRPARRRYADGFSLTQTVEAISGKQCSYLPLARQLPPPHGRPHEISDSRFKTFLFVGRYHQNKGPDQLISAVSGMFRTHRDATRFYMFGFGEMGGNLHKQVAEAGLEEVILIGEEICAQSLSDWLAYVDYLVIPSRIDSIPVIAADAIRANCPIIAMPVGDLPWLVNYYRCGILADDASPEGLRRAILRATYTADRSAFVAGCRAAAKRFDIQESVKLWEASWSCT